MNTDIISTKGRKTVRTIALALALVIPGVLRAEGESYFLRTRDLNDANKPILFSPSRTNFSVQEMIAIETGWNGSSDKTALLSTETPSGHKFSKWIKLPPWPRHFTMPLEVKAPGRWVVSLSVDDKVREVSTLAITAPPGYVPPPPRKLVFVQNAPDAEKTDLPPRHDFMRDERPVLYVGGAEFDGKFLRVEVLDGHHNVVAKREEKIQPTGGHFTLPLLDLAPGNYGIFVYADDKRAAVYAIHLLP